jgi:hypothetical protein
MRASEVFWRLAGAVDNPLDGVTPSMDIFGLEFSGRVSLILGGVWAMVLAASSAAVLVGGGKWAWAVKVSHSVEGALEAAGQFKTALVAFAGVAGASLLLGAIIWMVQG